MNLAETLARVDLTDERQQQQLYQWFEQCKDDQSAIQFACDSLTQRTYGDRDQVVFFLFLILEAEAKRLDTTDALVPLDSFKITLVETCKYAALCPNFVSSKIAQVMAVSFTKLYPKHWPDFFDCLIQCGPDILLSTLIQIDGEVVNRRIHHTKRELDRNTRLKDEMRVKDVGTLVSTWKEILEKVVESKISSAIGCKCLEVVGQYIEWIDINLVVNDGFMGKIFELLKRADLAEAVCDCLGEIVQKGMPPKEKCVLVESLYGALEAARLFGLQEHDELESIAKLICTCGSELMHQNEKFLRLEPPDQEGACQAMVAGEQKVELAIRLLANEDNDVSVETFDFLQTYIGRARTSNHKIPDEILNSCIRTVVAKSTYSSDYNFDRPGQDEAEADEFIQELKQLFESCCLHSPQAVMMVVKERLDALSPHLSIPEAEVTIRLLYNLGECLPVNMTSNSFNKENPSELQQLVQIFVGSSSPQHHAVVRLTLETIVRYSKFFQYHSEHLGLVLEFIVTSGGLLHSHGMVRSRAAYLFSKLVRELQPVMPAFSRDLLQNLQKVLFEGDDEFLSESDRSFVFEAAGYLAVCAPVSSGEKAQLFSGLLGPLVERFQIDTRHVVETPMEQEQQQIICTRSSQYVAWAGRITKCWKGPDGVNACSAQPILAETLKYFMKGLQIPSTIEARSVVMQSVRTFLHRMLICMGEDILVLLPDALAIFLERVEFRELHELFPLINQIGAKFKEKTVPLISPLLSQILANTFQLIDSGTGESEEIKTITRDFYNFINQSANNNSLAIFTNNETHIMKILSSVEAGARSSDPVAAKLCFTIFSKLAKDWGQQPWFGDIIQNQIIPACILGPASPNYDLKDAQTQMAIAESAVCMKVLFEIHGDGLVEYLRNTYLPSLSISSNIGGEYCEALAKKEIKAFKCYVKVFFGRSHQPS
ncbi:unnamed protein product [Oikopleura dioica]|uniref:Exportin-T n=1 Tax=Oikopleura dioica TaxID=34765 RepID=E4XWG8_OIKDI|nr:unnamed protein product [Oikopleura dioica]